MLLNLSRGTQLNPADLSETRAANVATDATDTAVVITEAHGSWSKGWVAALSLAPVGAKYPVDRQFLRASKIDLSRAGNGTKRYSLPEGLYEADSVAGSYRSHRVVFVVRAGGEIEVLADSETTERVSDVALEWLRKDAVAEEAALAQHAAASREG